jgi:hypothetical protein
VGEGGVESADEIEDDGIGEGGNDTGKDISGEFGNEVDDQRVEITTCFLTDYFLLLGD